MMWEFLTLQKGLQISTSTRYFDPLDDHIYSLANSVLDKKHKTAVYKDFTVFIFLLSLLRSAFSNCTILTLLRTYSLSFYFFSLLVFFHTFAFLLLLLYFSAYYSIFYPIRPMPRFCLANTSKDFLGV